MKINYNNKLFEITPSESLKLEIRLNLSPYGKEWKHIGDHLFYHGIHEYSKDKDLNVNEEQYTYLYNLFQIIK